MEKSERILSGPVFPEHKNENYFNENFSGMGIEETAKTVSKKRKNLSIGAWATASDRRY